MNREEKYLSRIILKNKFYEADKQSYEDLFTKIMQSQDLNFKQIKPQGSLGDGKCDGFNEKTGEYYQVYAPEELKGNEETLLSKMDLSISGLIDFWNEKGFVVKKFNYVIKDNYRNTYALVHTNAKLIAKKYNIECEIITCKDVEDIFINLSDEDINCIIGLVPDPLNIENVEYDILNEVIGFLLNSKVPKISENIPIQPDFDKKISFNSLSKITSDFLNAGQRQGFVIKEYFELNSKFFKEELRQVFNNTYKKALLEIPESETKNDEIFQYILDKSSPKDNFAYYNAVYILMSYYFEYCDIFETPTNT
jgi:hypothetical protein